jgi:hypothetical protein
VLLIFSWVLIAGSGYADTNDVYNGELYGRNPGYYTGLGTNYGGYYGSPTGAGISGLGYSNLGYGGLGYGGAYPGYSGYGSYASYGGSGVPGAYPGYGGYGNLGGYGGSGVPGRNLGGYGGSGYSGYGGYGNLGGYGGYYGRPGVYG